MTRDTIDIWRRSNFIWGQTDCIMATCNHVLAKTGIDPAKPWRGTYHDRAGAEAILAQFGGALGLFKHGMLRAGFRMTQHMEPGFPVVCEIPGHEIAGVWIGPHVAFMAERRGCVEMRAKVVGAWSI